MSTLQAERAASSASLLRQLAVIQARRYATHPVFLVGVAVLVAGMVGAVDDAPTNLNAADDHVFVAFFIGVLGVVVGYRLTRTEDRALALLPSTPVSSTTRTLALAGACLVPAGVGALWFVVRVVTWQVWPPPDQVVAGIGGWLPLLVVTFTGSVVAALGGPLLGVTLGRWWRFPGGGVLGVVLLVAVTDVLAGLGAQQPGIGEHLLVNAGANLAPWTFWDLVDRPPDGVLTLVGFRDGSVYGHLVYTLGLCGLAVWAAVMRDAEGAERDAWRRRGWALAAVTAAAGLWSALG